MSLRFPNVAFSNLHFTHIPNILVLGLYVVGHAFFLKRFQHFQHMQACACVWSFKLALIFCLFLSGEWVGGCVSNLYPEDIVLGRCWHRLLQVFVQLLLHVQVSRDRPPDLWTDVMQRPQARLHTYHQVLLILFFIHQNNSSKYH